LRGRREGIELGKRHKPDLAAIYPHLLIAAQGEKGLRSILAIGVE
jgi:hypothetical protein